MAPFDSHKMGAESTHHARSADWNGGELPSAPLPLVPRPPSDLPYTICFSLISSLLVNFRTFMTSLSLMLMLYSSFETPMLEKGCFSSPGLVLTRFLGIGTIGSAGRVLIPPCRRD
jgi:hypothetical protein